MSQPLVSVLMTSYNREKYIAEAIESVLASTYTNFELIIVDDCSKDQTVEIARSYEKKDSRISIHVNEQNLGDYNNRNKAASFATGKYLKYLDSDDLIYPNGLEIFVRGMEQFPNAAIGFSSQSTQEEKPFPIFFSAADAYRNHFFKKGILDCGPTGVIIRSDAFRSVKGFSGKRMIGDFELWLKIAAQHPVVILPPALIFWRIHDGQEFFRGVEDGIYLQMKLPVIVNAMLSENCPLNEDEKSKVIEHNRKLSALGVLQLLKRKKISFAKAAHKELMLKFTDYVHAMLYRKSF